MNTIAGGKAIEKHGPAPKGEQLRSVITSDKLFKEFKWKPSVKIDEGLKKTFDSFKTKILNKSFAIQGFNRKNF